MSRANVLVALEIQHLSLVFSRQKFWSCLFKLNLHFPGVCLRPLAGWSTSYGILSMMLIDASYTYGSCRVALSSKKHENLSDKFLKEWKISKQPNDIQVWEGLLLECYSWLSQTPFPFAAGILLIGLIWLWEGKTPPILETCYWSPRNRWGEHIDVFSAFILSHRYLPYFINWAKGEKTIRAFFKVGESHV